MKRVLILDLDNTIYPVDSVSGDMFKELYAMIDDDLGSKDRQAAVAAKHELTRRAFQLVADEYGFGEELKNKGINLLRNMAYDKPMRCYPEYETLRSLNIDKYLVTTGFTKLQTSKFKMLDITGDFKECIVVDPDQSDLTKKDIFEKIVKDNGYAIGDVLVIGDDPQSEIKAAHDLGIDTFLFDPNDKYPHANVTYRGKNYERIAEIIRQ